MRKSFAWTLTWGAVAGLLCQAPGVAFSQSQPAPVVTIDECRALNDADVRDRIRELASTNLKAELTTIDYPALVNKYWTKDDVSARIDREVDAAVAAVRADSSWLDRAYSTVSKSSAGRYATAVADRTYNSEGFKAALDELATGVAKDAGAQIEAATSKVSNPIVACVQTALQSRYGGAIAQVFAQESQKNLEAKAEQPAIKIGTSDLVLNNAASISGIVILVTRRVIAGVVEGIGDRIAGVVASRIISSVAGLIGLALIAKDIYEAGEGVFPIVSERMKSDETKAVIKDEIGKTIQADITQQVGTIAQETADRIYAVWLDFKQKYKLLLSLSEKNPDFAGTPEGHTPRSAEQTRADRRHPLFERGRKPHLRARRRRFPEQGAARSRRRRADDCDRAELHRRCAALEGGCGPGFASCGGYRHLSLASGRRAEP